MARLAGSLWSVPATQQRDRLSAAVAGGLGLAHWDATDGKFAAAGGFTPAAAAAHVEGLGVASEAHLMMHRPHPMIDAWAELCELIVVPVEIDDWAGALRRIDAAGVVGALALSPDTEPDLMPRGDFPVLVMSVQPGEAGAEFRPDTTCRVRELAQRGCHRMVGVDGGVQAHHLAGLRQAGATWVVSGTDLFTAVEVGEWVRSARTALA